jgi:hypothetical protein
MTVPAIPAMPQLISANNSPRAHAQQVGADQQRRLDMADKDVHRRAEAERPADPDGAPQHPGKSLHDQLQDAPVEQQRRQGADHQHHRQRLEREDKAGTRLGLDKRQIAPAEIAENKAGASVGRLLQRLDALVQQQEHGRCRREFEKQQGEAELQQHAGDDDPPRHAKPVLADRPGDEQQDGDAEEPSHFTASGSAFGG